MPDGGTPEQAVMSSPPRRVLVADADVEARTWCARALRSVDYDVVEAADGREALTNALVHRPALLITEHAEAHTHRSANLVAHGKKQLALSRTYSRFATTTPPMPAPTLTCQVCNRPLTYEYSHIGGVNAHAPEQWDLFQCTAGCGHFKYRQRTHRLRRVS